MIPVNPETSGGRIAPRPLARARPATSPRTPPAIEPMKTPGGPPRAPIDVPAAAPRTPPREPKIALPACPPVAISTTAASVPIKVSIPGILNGPSAFFASLAAPSAGFTLVATFCTSALMFLGSLSPLNAATKGSAFIRSSIFDPTPF